MEIDLMKQFDWKKFLHQQPIFSSLSDIEIERLLEDVMSQEKTFAQNEIIIREGALGDSVFIVGAGQVTVVLVAPGGTQIPLAVLRAGDFFGEMALIEQRPRSATVIATEPSVLLEIQGQRLLQLLHQRPDIEFKMLFVLSERLRHVIEQVLAVTQKDVDKKLELFNTKLDAELKVINASLVAAQAVFDQTSKRADEVITSAERRRTQLTISISAIGIILTTLASGLSYFGIKTFEDIKQTIAIQVNTIGQLEKTAADSAAQANKASQMAASSENDAKENLKRLETTYQQMIKYQEGYKEQIYQEFAKDFGEDITASLKIFKLALDINDRDVLDRFLSIIVFNIFEKPKYRNDYRDQFLRRDPKAISISHPRETVALYYIKIISLMLDGKQKTPEYLSALEEFRENSNKYTNQNVKSSFPPDLTFDKIEKLIDAIDGTSENARQEIKKDIKDILDEIPD